MQNETAKEDASKLKKKSMDYKSRPCRRLLCKKRELDSETKEMYENILEVKKERENY